MYTYTYIYVFLRERTCKIQGNFFELGLAGVLRLMGENSCGGANELFIPRSTLPHCPCQTGALALLGVGLGNFGFKAKSLLFYFISLSVVSV